MKQLDIGCSGFTRTWDGYECYGVDIVKHDIPNIKQADLVLEKIPFEDNTFDLVTAYDFLEHIPMVIYAPKRRQVMVELFNEIYRVMKNGGIFYSQTPIYPNKSAFQDPTHVSFWTDETMNYFSGDYYGWHDQYGHTSRFELIDKQADGLYAKIKLKAIKDVQGEYKIKY